MDAFTKRSHYNPCFWTALWNADYFDAWLTGNPKAAARSQTVLALNARANKIHPVRVEDIYYMEGVGTAEITAVSMKEFCRRRFPEKYDEIASYVDNTPNSLFLDFEAFLRGIEQKAGYDELMSVARAGDFGTTERKTMIMFLVVLHAMRSYEFMSAMLGVFHSSNKPSWEYFWLLRHAWSNSYVLSRATVALAMAQWTLYRTSEHRFPLCDSPVMIGRNSLMTVLSPRLLLEIDLLRTASEDQWVVKDGISSSKYWEFRRRAIQNTFTHIIFHDDEALEAWRTTADFRRRVRLLDSEESRQGAIGLAATRVTWAIEGFGRVPADFESWIGKHFPPANKSVGGGPAVTDERPDRKSP